jgi:ComF family protein
MDRTIAAVYYDDVVRAALHHFKFNHKTALGGPLAELLLASLPNDMKFSHYHAVIPVPLHPSRQRQRGYNQSAILAKYVAKRMNVPIMSNNLRRIRPTDEQALIAGRDARRQNVEQAFQVTSPASVQGKSVIVIDDIMTTGATVNECARVLKKSGAASVLVLAVARRVLRSQNEYTKLRYDSNYESS